MPYTQYVDSNLVANVTGNGERTEPLQPAFLAYLGSNDTNVTGNNTLYTLGTNVALTEVYDQNGDFNTNGTFTAPVTGRYFLYFNCRLDDATSTANDWSIYIVTSNRTYQSRNNFSGNGFTFNLSAVADMDASDTAVFKVQCAGVGADSMGIISSLTYVCGYLVC